MALDASRQPCSRSWLSISAVVLAITTLPSFVADRRVRVVAAPSTRASAPEPLLRNGEAVDWWFVFKFNASKFPGCPGNAERSCPFGGIVRHYSQAFGQQFVYASSEDSKLQEGTGACLGDATTDPVGATFDEVYSGSFHYIVWNDQFYDHPLKNQGDRWGHSKGMLAWNDDGEGLVMQVTTPSWPGAGNHEHPRASDGNSLGCVNDNDVEASQHFFALRLSKDDLVKVLEALENSSVVADPGNAEIANNGGPADVQALVSGLGKMSTSKSAIHETLSSGVELISKPSQLEVPPWQMVSSVLDGVPLRTATWWMNPEIPSTTATTHVGCWDDSLAAPGAVEIATTGHWGGTVFGLTGTGGPNFNHAKIGVSTSADNEYTIFGDLNQQGTLSGSNCHSSQNGRGGLFFVLKDHDLFQSVSELIAGNSAAVQ